MLSLYFLLTVRFGVKRRVFAHKYEKWLHILTVSFFLATAMAGIVTDMYSELEYVFGGFDCFARLFALIHCGCKESTLGKHCSHTPSLFCRITRRITQGCWIGSHIDNWIVWIYGGVPFVFVYLSLPISNMIIYCYVRKQFGMTRGKLSTTAAITDKANTLTPRQEAQQLRVKEVAQQGFLYVTAFYLVHTPAFVVRVLEGMGVDRDEESEIYWILVANSILLPLQGWFNLLYVVTSSLSVGSRLVSHPRSLHVFLCQHSIYMMPHYTRVRKAYPEMSAYWAVKLCLVEMNLPTLEESQSCYSMKVESQHDSGRETPTMLKEILESGSEDSDEFDDRSGGLFGSTKGLMKPSSRSLRLGMDGSLATNFSIPHETTDTEIGATSVSLSGNGRHSYSGQDEAEDADVELALVDSAQSLNGKIVVLPSDFQWLPAINEKRPEQQGSKISEERTLEQKRHEILDERSLERQHIKKPDSKRLERKTSKVIRKDKSLERTFSKMNQDDNLEDEILDDRTLEDQHSKKPESKRLDRKTSKVTRKDKSLERKVGRINRDDDLEHKTVDDRILERQHSMKPESKRLERKTSKVSKDKSLERKYSKRRQEESLDKTVTKVRKDRSLERQHSRVSEENGLEGMNREVRRHRSLDRQVSKRKQDERLEEITIKVRKDRSLERKVSKVRKDKSLERRISRIKEVESVEQVVSKVRKDKSLERKVSKRREGDSVELVTTKVRKDKSLERKVSKRKQELSLRGRKMGFDETTTVHEAQEGDGFANVHCIPSPTEEESTGFRD